MQMSNVILPQKEDIDLDAFPMTLIIYLYVNNKTRKDKQFYYFHMANLVIFCLNITFTFFYQDAQNKMTMLLELINWKYEQTMHRVK